MALTRSGTISATGATGYLELKQGHLVLEDTSSFVGTLVLETSYHEDFSIKSSETITLGASKKIDCGVSMYVRLNCTAYTSGTASFEFGLGV
jgi:hypothetical protein